MIYTTWTIIVNFDDHDIKYCGLLFKSQSSYIFQYEFKIPKEIYLGRLQNYFVGISEMNLKRRIVSPWTRKFIRDVAIEKQKILNEWRI